MLLLQPFIPLASLDLLALASSSIVAFLLLPDMPDNILTVPGI